MPVVIVWLTKKTEPEGAGQETSGPLLSVRNEVEPADHQPCARTRWVTERIASLAVSQREPPESTDEMTGSNRALQNKGPGASGESARYAKIWERQFFYLLTPALMGDPGVSDPVPITIWKHGEPTPL